MQSPTDPIEHHARLPHTPFPFLPPPWPSSSFACFQFLRWHRAAGFLASPSTPRWQWAEPIPSPAWGGLEGSSLPEALCCVGRGGAALRPTQPVQQLVTGGGEQRALPPSPYLKAAFREEGGGGAGNPAGRKRCQIDPRCQIAAHRDTAVRSAADGCSERLCSSSSSASPCSAVCLSVSLSVCLPPARNQTPHRPPAPPAPLH